MAFFYLWIHLKSISWLICDAAIGMAMQNDDVYAMYLPFRYEDKQMCCLATVLIIISSCTHVSRDTLQSILAFLWLNFVQQSEINAKCLHLVYSFKTCVTLSSTYHSRQWLEYLNRAFSFSVSNISSSVYKMQYHVLFINSSAVLPSKCQSVRLPYIWLYIKIFFSGFWLSNILEM